MHQFICKVVGGKIVPLQHNKEKLLKTLLADYERLGMKLKLTVEVIEKNINEQQISLYKAFIIKASNHFGNTFREMEIILIRFYPINSEGYKISLNKWTPKQLNDFIDKASALLTEQGFKF